MAYREILDEVDYFASQNRAAMVLKYDRQAVDQEVPETVVRSINKQVIWNNQGLDITDFILEKTGLLGMIGKAERGPVAIEAIRDNRAVYLMAVGGAAYLVSKAITASRVLAFPELGMEAIYEFEVKDMPVTVAVDSNGISVHETGPKLWKARIEEQAISVV